jgi:hypothetical protein
MNADRLIILVALVLGPVSALLISRMVKAWRRDDLVLVWLYAVAIPCALLLMSVGAGWMIDRLPPLAA